MTREEKNQQIAVLTEQIQETPVFYLADISELDAEATSKLRRECHKSNISLKVVKNTLLKQALDKVEGDYAVMTDILKGNTSIMFAEAANAPAKLIKEFRKKSDKPILKAAYIDKETYLGDDQLDMLAALKSKEELIGEIVTLLQSPAKNVISALSSGGSKLSGILKTLENK